MTSWSNGVALHSCIERDRETRIYWARIRRLVLCLLSCEDSANPMGVSGLSCYSDQGLLIFSGRAVQRGLPLHIVVYV